MVVVARRAYMKIELTREHEVIDRVLQASEVAEAICPDGVEMRSVKVLDDGSRIFLLVREGEAVLGCFIVGRMLSGVYEVHTCLTKQCRGKRAVEAGKLGTEWMFLHTDATRLYSLCPASNRASLLFAYAVGFKHAFHRADYWLKNGVREGAAVVDLTVQQWAYRNAERFRAVGQKFHEQLFAGRAEHEHHGEDGLHDGMLGLALTMGGVQPWKAQDLYNTWAVAAGYAPGQFKGRLPTGDMLVDIAEALVTYHPGTHAVSILKGYVCRQEQS